MITADRSLLVVADDPAIVGTVGLVFRALGYQLRVAVVGDDALALIAKELPTIVLCDADLAGLDASDFTRKVRALEGGDNVLVVLTGYGAEPPLNAADGFAPRPFDPIKVSDLIDVLSHKTIS